MIDYHAAAEQARKLDPESQNRLANLLKQLEVNVNDGDVFINGFGAVVGPLRERQNSQHLAYKFKCPKGETYSEHGEYVVNECSDHRLVEKIDATDPRHPNYEPTFLLKAGSDYVSRDRGVVLNVQPLSIPNSPYRYRGSFHESGALETWTEKGKAMENQELPTDLVEEISVDDPRHPAYEATRSFQLEAGKTYRTRYGQTVTVREGTDPVYCFQGEIEGVNRESWTRDGRVYVWQESPRDLVEEVRDGLELCAYYVTRDGNRVVGPVEESDDPEYPYTDGTYSWTKHGLTLSGQHSALDAVEKLEVTDTRHPLAPRVTIQEGEYYIRQDGKVVGPAGRMPGEGGFDFGIGNYAYYQGGRIGKSGHYHSEDLAAHLPRTDERHPNYVEPLITAEGQYFLRKDGKVVGPSATNKGGHHPWTVNQFYLKSNGVCPGAENRNLVEKIEEDDPRHPDYVEPLITGEGQYFLRKDGKVVGPSARSRQWPDGYPWSVDDYFVASDGTCPGVGSLSLVERIEQHDQRHPHCWSLEEGECYRTRGGKVVGPLRVLENPLYGEFSFTCPGSGKTWRPDGTWALSHNVNMGWDLVHKVEVTHIDHPNFDPQRHLKGELGEWVEQGYYRRKDGAEVYVKYEHGRYNGYRWTDGNTYYTDGGIGEDGTSVLVKRI